MLSIVLLGHILILSKTPENPNFIALVIGPSIHSMIAEEVDDSLLGVYLPIKSLIEVSGVNKNKKFSFLFSSGVKYQDIHFAT